MWKVDYEFGELNANGTVDSAKNTGNIAKQTISFSGLSQPFVQEYKYDSLYRLTEAKETGNSTQNWKQEFGYDRYGNRTSYNKFSGTSAVTLTAKEKPTIDANNNRFNSGQGYSYDKTGNLVSNFEGWQFTFNGDNKQKEVKDSAGNVIGTYFYNGDGMRIKKVTNSETVVFVYSGGKKIAEYSTDLTVNASTKYLTEDHLGTPRVISDQNGAVLSRRDMMPFGEDLKDGVGARDNSNKYGIDDKVREGFTGYEKDKETGLDFAEARMYENRHGRFTAVDPLLASGLSASPQTFNRYVYIGNSPLSDTDPSGQCPIKGCPDNYSGTVYYRTGKDDRREYSTINDGTFDEFKGTDSFINEKTGLFVHVTKDGWMSGFSRPSRSAANLLGNGVSQHLSAIGPGTLARGIGNSFINGANGFLDLSFRTSPLRFIFDSPQIGKFEYLNSLDASYGSAIEIGSGIAGAKGAFRFRGASPSALRVTPTKLDFLQVKLEKLADESLLPFYRAIDPHLKAGYTGSFRTGRVGSRSKDTFGLPINLHNFDVDYWIKSDKLFRRYGNSDKANPIFRNVLQKTEGFEGLRPNKKGFSIRFLPGGN